MFANDVELLFRCSSLFVDYLELEGIKNEAF